ncbi:MAG: response regulator transcription factor [Steroidobacteraceae bacterium]
MRVLIVEDDVDVSRALSSALSLEAHRVEVLSDGVRALDALRMDAFDAVILDLEVPRMSGLEVLRRLRNAGSQVPVLILTARGRLQDGVSALDSGADDYLVKPFDIHDLGARLRAIVRRSRGRAAPVIECGDVRVEPASRSVTRGGEIVEVSPREYAILLQLMDSIGEVVSRERLMAALYGWDVDGIDSNTIDVHVSHLRRKLGKDFIRTLRSVGYIIDQPGTVDKQAP